jgi:hypothetical protein
MASRLPWQVVALAVLTVSACNSHPDSVCEQIGDCSEGGSSDWIASCQSEANALKTEAGGAGCGSTFDAYFACADSNYSCRGATALFPGCDGLLAALDTCLASAIGDTSCAQLEAAEAACASSAPDAGTATGAPPACTAARDCQARCYLDHVADVCAPGVDEIPAVSTCAASCPP